jgi:myosin heavy subunit
MIEGMSDANRYLLTSEVLTLLGVSNTLKVILWKALASILYLGQLNFITEEESSEAASIDMDNISKEFDVRACCELMGLDISVFRNTLVSRTIEVEGMCLR